MPSYLEKLISSQDLTSAEASGMAHLLMAGELAEAQIGALLTALRIKGETVDEITAMAEVMRAKAQTIHLPFPVLDTCGTGGDGANTFNISTTAAFLLAAGGVKVAKHGNRSVTSKSGSADVLEALGVSITFSPAQMEQALAEIGLGFMFAPAYHPAVKHVMPARKALGVRTIFNILGPLASPARAEYQLLGVFDPALTEPLASVLAKLGTNRALVVHGSGLDELTLAGTSRISELREGKVATYEISPAEFNLPATTLEELAGGTPAENALLVEQILSGKGTSAQQGVVALNAGAGFYVAGQADSIQAGVEKAQQLLTSGEGFTVLARLRSFTQKFA